MTERVAGVDEAGRGSLAGPVVAAAVVLPAGYGIEGLADSKRIIAAQRETLACRVQAHALAWAVMRVAPAEIDAVNVLNATMRAMQGALAALSPQPTRALIDGDRCPELTLPAEALVGGDGRVPAISAASIIAKVARDADMVALDAERPGYGFGAHKGYGTAAHRDALARLGACPAHRRSFAPVRAALADGVPTQACLDIGSPGG